MISTKRFQKPGEKAIFRDRLGILFPTGMDTKKPNVKEAYAYLVKADLPENLMANIKGPTTFYNCFNPNNPGPVFGGDLILWSMAFRPVMEKKGIPYSEDYFNPDRVNTTPVGDMQIKAVGEVAKMTIAERRRMILDTMLNWISRTVQYDLTVNVNGLDKMDEEEQNKDLMDSLVISRLFSLNFNDQPGDLDAVKQMCDETVAAWDKIV